MVESFKRSMEGNDSHSNHSEESLNVYRDTSEPEGRDQQEKGNMQKLDNRLSMVTKGLEALTDDPKSNDFLGQSSNQIRGEYEKWAKSANTYKSVAEKTSDKATKEKFVASYENAVERLEQLHDRLGDYIYNIKQLDRRMVAVGKRVGELLRGLRSSDFPEMLQIQRARKDMVRHDASYKRSHDGLSRS